MTTTNNNRKEVNHENSHMNAASKTTKIPRSGQAGKPIKNPVCPYERRTRHRPVVERNCGVKNIKSPKKTRWANIAN